MKAAWNFPAAMNLTLSIGGITAVKTMRFPTREPARQCCTGVNMTAVLKRWQWKKKAG